MIIQERMVIYCYMKPTDKDYLMKRAVMCWIFGIPTSVINFMFNSKNIYMSNSTLRVRIHRFKEKLSYSELNEIVKSIDIPEEILQPERMLARRGIFPEGA